MEPWGSHPSQHSQTAELRASERSMAKDEGSKQTDGEAVRCLLCNHISLNWIPRTHEKVEGEI